MKRLQDPSKPYYVAHRETCDCWMTSDHRVVLVFAGLTEEAEEAETDGSRVNVNKNGTLLTTAMAPGVFIVHYVELC